ncbi:MAG: response regulator transcription factor [Chitinophagaceae bacterium]|nr:response regulator transcription factor [Chitinophagaceae bacterium]
MIKALIIDDEPSAVKTLTLLLSHYVPEISELKSTNDPHDGLRLLKTYQPDLLFLDIQMPLMTGFGLLKQLPEINFNIIFTTAHDQYAIEAIRFSALDYLMKPIDGDELQQAIKRYMGKLSSAISNRPLYNNFLHNIHAADSKGFKLALPTTQGTFFYKTEEIIRLEGESNYTKFYFTGNKTLVTSRTLKEYEEILSNHGFIRIHKSHIVNKAHVVNYSGDGLLTLVDNSKVEISRRRREEVIQRLKSL